MHTHVLLWTYGTHCVCITPHRRCAASYYTTPTHTACVYYTTPTMLRIFALRLLPHQRCINKFISLLLFRQTSLWLHQPHACDSHRSRECVVLLHFAAKLSSTSSFSPAPASPTLRIPAGHSQPSTRAPAATFPHNPSHRVRDRCAPTSMQPHRLVKINFYSINRTRRLGADADQHSLSTSSDVYHVVNLIRSKVFSNRKLLSPCCVANTRIPAGHSQPSTSHLLNFDHTCLHPQTFMDGAPTPRTSEHVAALRATRCGLFPGLILVLLLFTKILSS